MVKEIEARARLLAMYEAKLIDIRRKIDLHRYALETSSDPSSRRKALIKIKTRETEVQDLQRKITGLRG